MGGGERRGIGGAGRSEGGVEGWSKERIKQGMEKREVEMNKLLWGKEGEEENWRR